MPGQKHSPLRSRYRSYLRLLSGSLLAGLLSVPGWSQPLESAVRGADDRVFFLDEGKVRSVSPQGSVQVELELEKASKLYSQAGWKESFLVQAEEGLFRVETGKPRSAKLVVPGDQLQVDPWGEEFLVHVSGASDVFVVSPQGERKLTLTGSLSELVRLDETVLAKTTGGFWVLKKNGKNFEPVKLPFPLEEASIAQGDERAIIWSSKSEQMLDVSSGDILRSRTKPEIGVRVLDDGSVLASSLHAMTLLSPSGGMREFLPPSGVTASTFLEWRIFWARGVLDVISMKDDRPQILHYTSHGFPMDTLPKGKILEVVLPGKEGGSPLLFLETTTQEDQVDSDGRLVLDLSTGQPRQLTVNGHKVFQLDFGRRHWTEISGDPRGALVGPIQKVGGHVIYATQTEPSHTLGRSLEQNRKYPYPAVILHGQSQTRPEERWSFEKPRGETPAKGRLPESQWPLLGDKGPVLLTSEGDSLLAIDPSNGELQWRTEGLPLDDSSPLMLAWKDGLALVATDNSTKRLIFVDPANGSLGSSAALNDTFFWGRWRHLLGVIVVCAALAYYIYAAGKRELYIRKIAGLQALDEAVGRATEMGKPVLYVVGLADVDDIQTLASLSILSHVARKTAEYDTPIVTTTSRAVTFSAAQEIVRDAYSVAGRPDAFSVESVRYISDDQFGYTAGVDGIMVREKPAANFYIGNFYAESLILAETGHATGSIQIAGTAQPNQLPFFVAACDYTLIGEELFAASAYLSRDPLQVGSLRGQDVGKMIVMVLLVVCSLLVSMGIDGEKIAAMTGLNLP